MENLTFPRPVFLLLMCSLIAGAAGSVQAANILKANTTTMNGSGDWGGTAPTSASIGEFGSTPTATTLAGMTLGGNVGLGGLQFDNNMAGPVSIAAGSTLTLTPAVSTSGIDMSAANNDVTMANAITLGADQTWNIGASRTLTTSGVITGSKTLIKDGAGTLIKGSPSDANTGMTITAGTLKGKPCSITGTVTVNGGTWDLAGLQRQINILNGTGGQVINNGTTINLIVGNGGGSGSYSGVIANGTGLTGFRKQGAGTTTLTGTNTFTGGITIDAGSGPLSIGGAGQLDSGSYAGTITFSGGTFSYDSSVVQTLSGSITGTGALTQNGPGTLTLSGTLNNYSGLTTVAGGTLAVSSAQTSQAGAISVSDGATLKVNVSGTSQIPPSSLIVGSSTGGTLEFSNITSKTTSPINVSGALTINGTASIKIDSLPSAVAIGDSYPLVAYGSGGSGTVTIASLPVGVTAHLTTGSSPIALVIDTVSSTVWSAGNGNWDTSTTNWTIGGSSTTYADGQKVRFDDTPSGSGPFTVSITPASVSPASVVVNNTNKNYTIGGNPITGATTSLAKSGAGALTLSGTNSFGGGTTVSAGTLAISGSGTLGGSSGALTVSGGILNLGGTSQSAGAVTLSGGTIQNGTLTGTSCGLQSGTVSGVLAGGIAATKTTAGTVILSVANTYSGGTAINGGTLQVKATETAGTSGPLGASGTITFGGGTLQYSSANNYDYSSRFSLPAAMNVDLNGQSVTFATTFGGSSSLTVGDSAGGGILTLSSVANGYTGATTINSGTLRGKPGSINSAVLTMNGGTFDLFGTTEQLVSLNGLAGAQIVNNGAACTLHVGNNNPANPGTFAGVIANGTGPLSLTTRQNNGTTFTLSGPNTFSGLTTIYAGGTLNIGGSGQLGSGVYDGSIANSGTFAYSSSAAQILSGNITGAGALTQNGPGTLTLSGTGNTYSGTTTIGGGILAVSSAQTGTGAISVSGGATLKVNVSSAGWLRPSAFTVGSSTGGTLEFNGITSKGTAPINVNGALTINGTASIKIDSLPDTALVGDSYPLVAYGSGGIGTMTIASLPAGITEHLTTGSSPIKLVIDDFALPHISITATTPLAKEGGNAGAITLTRSGKTNQTLTVGYSISGTASNGVDYARLSGVVNLAAGQTQSVISINPLIDAAAESVETVTLNLNQSTNYNISGLGSASVLIMDATNSNPYNILAFDDEFNGPGLDRSVWAFEGGRTNVAVTNGSLELIPHKYGTDWVEGSVQTTNYATKYGYFECRLKVNDVDGMNNSFWLNTPWDLVANNIDRFEIDVTEAKHKDGRNGSGIWDNAPKPPGWGAHGGTYITNISDIYRTITLEWKNDNSLTYSWDGGVPFYTNVASEVLSADTMIPVSVLCSALVASFAGQAGSGLDGSRMYVDYVRIWQKPGWIGAVNGNWGSATNWGPDGVPGSGYAAIFNGPSANIAVSLAADKFCHSLCFDNAACPAFTFPAGAFSLHLGAAVDGVGGITICTSVTNSQTINLNLVADRELQFGNFSRTPNTTLYLNGNIDGIASGTGMHFTGYAPIRVGGALSANIGNIFKWGSNTTWLTGTNAQSGINMIMDGVLVAGSPSALGSATSGTVVSNGASLVFVGGTQYLNPEPVSLSGVGDITRSGALDVEGSGKALFSGPLTLLGDTTIAGGANGSELELAGSIAGAFAVTKTGTGVLTLSGTNSYTGDTTVTAGGLTLNGTSVSAVTVTGGTLAGSGVISNNVTLLNSIHTPGNGVGSQTIYGDYTLDSGSVLRIEINSTNPATQSDRVRVLGGTANTVTLAGALDISAPPGLTNGTVIMVIENDGTDAVSGTFSGLPQNYAFLAGGYWWRISYTGGDGNDVVITLIAPPKPQFTFMQLSGGFAQFGMTGETNRTFGLQASTNLVQWSSITNLFNATGTLLFTDTSSTNYNRRFYRWVLLP